MSLLEMKVVVLPATLPLRAVIGIIGHCHCFLQVLEVLQKASQTLKVTWKTDDLDKENGNPLPAAGDIYRYLC